jgi:hypothetical protein
MLASRAGNGPLIAFALSIAAMAAVTNLRPGPPAPPLPVTPRVVRVELRSPTPPPPQAVPVKPPQEVRCCPCAMERARRAQERRTVYR